jgi:hypothetical protein
MWQALTGGFVCDKGVFLIHTIRGTLCAVLVGDSMQEGVLKLRTWEIFFCWLLYLNVCNFF